MSKRGRLAALIAQRNIERRGESEYIKLVIDSCHYRRTAYPLAMNPANVRGGRAVRRTADHSRWGGIESDRRLVTPPVWVGASRGGLGRSHRWNVAPHPGVRASAVGITGHDTTECPVDEPNAPYRC